MTPREALKVIDKTHKYPCPYGIGGTAWMYIRRCIEKQIPKRINEYNRCPCCDTYNETIEKRKNTVKYDICYCWHCGQALDWSVDNG